MCFSPQIEEKVEELSAEVRKIDWTMYVPQMVMLAIVFALGVLMPQELVGLIQSTVIGLN